MSRIANNPVAVPAGVEVKLDGQQISVKGSKGSLAMDVHKDVEVMEQDGTLTFAARSASKTARAMSGTTRALIGNMVMGVSEGFERRLQLITTITAQRTEHITCQTLGVNSH